MGAEGYLTDEWIAACNTALGAIGFTVSTPLVVTERITDAEPGERAAVTLVADSDGIRLLAGEDPQATAWLSLSMEDVAALHAGELDPAQALTQGRVRVRGDLRAVVEAAGLLASAHRAMRDR